MTDSAPLIYPFPHPPQPGALQAVAPGVHWVRMPLPFALDHINLWVLEDGDGWTLVDTGIGSAVVKGLWQQLLDGPLAGRPLKRIIVTHFHPDHMGLAGWLSRRLQAPVLMTEGEAALAYSLHAAGGEERAARQHRFFGRHGLSASQAAATQGGNNPYRERVPELPEGVERVADGQLLRIGAHHWRVLVGRGHSPEHMCLYAEEAGLLLAGDQVLPRISPNVSVSFLNPDADPLSEYLSSLQMLAQLPASVRVLPAHGPVFEGLLHRLAALQAHHQERLQLLRELCRQPVTAAETLPVLFTREFDAHELFFALGEAVAHLHCLEARGELRSQQDANGVTRFVMNQPQAAAL